MAPRFKNGGVLAINGKTVLPLFNLSLDLGCNPRCVRETGVWTDEMQLGFFILTSQAFCLFFDKSDN